MGEWALIIFFWGGYVDHVQQIYFENKTLCVQAREKLMADGGPTKETRKKYKGLEMECVRVK